MLHRTNVCDRQRRLWNGTIELPFALEGLNITAVVTNYQHADNNKLFTLVDNKIVQDNPGLFAVVMDEVARRGRFEWRNSFAVADPLNSDTDGNKTWTDILVWGVTVFDVSIEKWGFSLDRVSKGVSFPEGWWDSSVVFAERKAKQERAVNLWSFLSPFHWTVWVGIVLSVLLAGILYWFLEYLDLDADEGTLETNPMASIFYAGLIFTGNFELQPNTAAARIFSFGFTFWSLLVGAAYTANMASFLVSPIVQDLQYSTVDDAVLRDAGLCVQKGGVIADLLHLKYPSLKLVPIQGEQRIYESLRTPVDQGGCDAAAHQFNVYSVYRHNKNVNYDCSIQSEEQVVLNLPAGMATAIDTGSSSSDDQTRPPSFCTSLISHVLDYHLLEMINDGFIEESWSHHLNRVGTIECVEEQTPRVSFLEKTFSLGMNDMGGIFLLHALCTTVAVLVSLYQYFRPPPGVGPRRPLGEVFGFRNSKSRNDVTTDDDNDNNKNGITGMEQESTNPFSVDFPGNDHGEPVHGGNETFVPSLSRDEAMPRRNSKCADVDPLATQQSSAAFMSQRPTLKSAELYSAVGMR